MQHTDNKYQFATHIKDCSVGFNPQSIQTLQINITKLCNQACVHCHVDASPRRRESMSDAVIDQILGIVEKHPQIEIVDITGGAPELHPRFRNLVKDIRAMQRRVLVRHNLTVSMDPHPISKESLADLPEFFAENRVEVISSLPYYQEFFTDKQRGSGVFQKSIASLQKLNLLGYGHEGSNLLLNLVYNPVGAFLPPPQANLEQTYKKELWDRFEIRFNQLYAVTNMPIHRFKAQLRRLNTYEEYMETLVAAFNPAAAEGAMCRNMISISYDGKIFDCDFNQMLDMSISLPSKEAADVFSWDMDKLLSRRIKVADHCFGCTAGAGSSCGGNTSSTS
ncbi:MAG: arsenosugar biosynthesis radical SAM (seleno)protein ArsS [Oligoflexus sp.]